MKRKLALIVMITMLVFQHSFPVFAQATKEIPDICGAPAPHMILYQQFQQEISTLLLGGSLGKMLFREDIKVVGLFTSKVLTLPPQSFSDPALNAILFSLRNSALRLGSATLTTFMLLVLASSSVASANLEGLAILWQDRAIVRDWRTLLQIDARTSQIAYYLGKTVNLLSSVSVDASASLQEIFLSYESEGLFTGVATSSYGNISYFDILVDIALMNAAMKVFLASNIYHPLSTYKAPHLFETRFDPLAIAQLREDYSAVRGFSPCNPIFNRLGSSVKKSLSNTASAARESGAIIRDASKRLAAAFAKTTGLTTKKQKQTIAQQYFSEYELQQLRTIYGLDTSRMTQKDAVHWKNILGVLPTVKNTWNATMGVAKSGLEMAKKMGEVVVGSASGFLAWLRTFRDAFREHSAQKKAAKDSPSSVGNTAPSFYIPSFKEGSAFSAFRFSASERNSMMLELGDYYNKDFDDALHSAFSTSFERTLAFHKQSSVDFVAAEVTSWTSIFHSLVNQVQELEGVIGSKTSRIGLIKNLATACERQCANKGNASCWST